MGYNKSIVTKNNIHSFYRKLVCNKCGFRFGIGDVIYSWWRPNRAIRYFCQRCYNERMGVEAPKVNKKGVGVVAKK